MCLSVYGYTETTSNTSVTDEETFNQSFIKE